MQDRSSEPTLRTIVKKLDKQNGDLLNRLIEMTAAMESHIRADAVAFAALAAQATQASKDLQSLLHSRSFLRGTWFAVGVFGTFIMAAITAFLMWYK